MLDTGIRLFETARQFRQLGRVECLHLMPQNEMAVLKLVADSALKDPRGLSVSEMAQRLNVSVPLVSRTLKRLREKGYIQSAADRLDRRSTRIVATLQGTRALEETMQRLQSFIRRVAGRMEEQELQQLQGLLEKLYHAMRTEALLWTQEEKNGTLNLNGQSCQEK